MLLVFLDYFSFIKRLMELLRMFTRIRKIELEIQTINQSTLDADHPSRFLLPIFRDFVRDTFRFLFNLHFSVEPYVTRLMLYDDNYLSESTIE